MKYPERVELPGPEPAFDTDIQEMLDLARAMPPLQVAESLRRPHPLITAARVQSKRDGMPIHQLFPCLRQNRQRTLYVDTSKNLYIRGLRIMDALIKRIEKIGGSVEIREDKRDRCRTETMVCFGGKDVCELRLREKLNQVRVRNDNRKYEWRKTELQPSGLLVLDKGYADSRGTLLRDTEKNGPLEDRLNDLVIDFARQAGKQRIKHREAEEARRRQEEQDRIRREREEELRRRRDVLARRQSTEQDRVDGIVTHAKSWQQSLIIRDYLFALGHMLVDRNGTIPLNGEAADYLKRAHQQADRLDPLRASPPSVLDERI